MDTLSNFEKYLWCKQNWSYPIITDNDKSLLQQCTQTPELQLTDNVDEIIEKSKQFPIKFPIQTIRTLNLKTTRLIERLERNIISTYTVIHERVLILMAKFLNYKREFGSDIEKSLYKDMTVPLLIDRILKKRAISFVGPRDKYQLITGETGAEGWEEIGTKSELPPLILENCLSYDEMKLSALVYISGYTECINDGTRHNMGVVKDICEEEAVIIGVIGPRFHRRGKMDVEDILITKEQNVPENGYGKNDVGFFKRFKKENENVSSKHALREMWAEFYQTQPLTFKAVSSMKNGTNENTDRFREIVRGKLKSIFDNEVYYKRIRILTETTLIEANHRSMESEKNGFLNIIGCGLGVWMISKHQPDVYILTFLERISTFLKQDLLNKITDINFAYIKTSPDVEDLFTQNAENPKLKQLFLESKTHPKGGINVQMEDREPSGRLTGEHAGKLLVLTYPWDSNAHPGNEFWFGSLHTSGDPAAACSTQVAELHNAHINSAVCGHNVRVAGRSGLGTLAEYSLALTA